MIWTIIAMPIFLALWLLGQAHRAWKRSKAKTAPDAAKATAEAAKATAEAAKATAEAAKATAEAANATAQVTAGGSR
jgi:hypothetical protein